MNLLRATRAGLVIYACAAHFRDFPRRRHRYTPSLRSPVSRHDTLAKELEPQAN